MPGSPSPPRRVSYVERKWVHPWGRKEEGDDGGVAPRSRRIERGHPTLQC